MISLPNSQGILLQPGTMPQYGADATERVPPKGRRIGRTTLTLTLSEKETELTHCAQRQYRFVEGFVRATQRVAPTQHLSGGGSGGRGARRGPVHSQ
jgi:hypothetical protein